jgi:hypothetical protein
MKIANTILILLAVTIHTFSQITVSNTTFPKAGDTLKTKYLGSVDGVPDMGSTGGPKTWDFSKLTSGEKQQEVYVPVSLGTAKSSFPDANMILRTEDQDLYIRSSATKMEALGFTTTMILPDTTLILKYLKPKLLRTAPLQFINTTTSTGEIVFDISAKIIPDTLLATFPIKPDSIRLQFLNQEKGLVDAYGTLKISGKSFNVLRQKVEMINGVKIFVKIIGIWLDVSAILGDNNPVELIPSLTNDTTIVYNFISNDRKEIIVSAQYSTTGDFNGLSYVDLNESISSIPSITVHTMTISPNPAYEATYIRNGETEGHFTIQVADILGRSVYAEECHLGKSESKHLDISSWNSGYYFVNIIDNIRHTQNNLQLIKQ